MTWNPNNAAAVATYNILESDRLLDQFDATYLPFDNAGAKKLVELPYYPKFGADPADLEGRAMQMARYFFKYAVQLYSNKKERPEDKVQDAWDKLAKQFNSTTATMASLAEVLDDFILFPDEMRNGNTATPTAKKENNK